MALLLPAILLAAIWLQPTPVERAPEPVGVQEGKK